MRVRFGALLPSAIAIGFGLLTLIGLLAGGDGSLFDLLTTLFLQIVVITVALAFLLGILNLLLVHLGRLFGRKRGALYSLVLLLSFVLALTLAILERTGGLPARPAGERPLSMILLETVQVSIESALAGLLVFALVYGAYRMLRRRVTWGGLLFLAALLTVLLGEIAARGVFESPLLLSFRTWLSSVPVSAGARGLLLGIALATVIAGVRVLIGQDRSYRE
ncbi:MAG: hypothetical protein HXY40_19390 [Chloroflexi bacterium]|nr:hypothetical protein [Chloroflexota bacterium]